MTDTNAGRDELNHHDRVYLEKLRLATNVLLQHGEDPGVLSDILHTELFIFRDRIELALLLPKAAPGTHPGHDVPASGGESRPPDAG